MVASDSKMFTVVNKIVFVLLCFYVSLASASSQTEGRGRWSQRKHIIRSIRQTHQCVDGYYEHNNRNCCLCGAGYWLKEHCTLNLDDGKCELCERGTYSSHPNSQPSCEPCTSCSHPNANLEEKESCTPGSDAKCRCKKDHYCSSGTEETCKLCNPCKVCGAEGTKVICTATSDAVCNDKSEGGNHTHLAIIGVVIGFILVGGILFVVWWRKKSMRKQNITKQTDDNPIEMPLLKGAEISPHLPEIALKLGWMDMKDVAIRSGTEMTVIESCELDHHGDTQEKTLQLLIKWVEQQGMDAPTKLVQILQDSHKKLKAQMVAKILSSGNDATSHVSA
ncbi:hypothetical protein PAMP_001572 [Pampus punctatissimus]